MVVGLMQAQVSTCVIRICHNSDLYCCSKSNSSEILILCSSSSSNVSLQVEYTSAGMQVNRLYVFPEHLDGKGSIQVSCCSIVVLNFHAHNRVGMQEGWQIFGILSLWNLLCFWKLTHQRLLLKFHGWSLRLIR